MTDSSSNSAENSSSFADPVQPPEQNFFRNPAVPFTFVRVCLYLAMMEVMGYGLLWVAALWRKRGLSPYEPQGLMLGETIALGSAFTAAWVMSRLEKRSVGEYGLPSREAFGKAFWLGTLFGLAEVSAVIGVIAGLGSYHFGAMAIHGSEVIRWTIFWAAEFLIVGMYEEFAFRGYVQFALMQGAGFWPAAVLLSMIFGAVHLGNPGETWAGIAGIVLVAIFWCFTLKRTGNLWFAVGMHAAFDFGETFLFSVPDSGVIFPGHLSNATLAGPGWLTGGSAGPEASVLDFVVIVVFFYVVHRLYPAKSRRQIGRTAL